LGCPPIEGIGADRAFVATLRQVGLYTPDVAATAAIGRQQCQYIAEGYSVPVIETALRQRYWWLTAAQAAGFVNAAIQSYCPTGGTVIL
jgi:hypothetical protein